MAKRRVKVKVSESRGLEVRFYSSGIYHHQAHQEVPKPCTLGVLGALVVNLCDFVV